MNILARPFRVHEGPDDTVMAELAGEMMPVDEFVNQPEEQLTEAPVESDEEDAELIAAVQARTEEDVEDADDSAPRTPWSRRGPCARLAVLASKCGFLFKRIEQNIQN